MGMEWSRVEWSGVEWSGVEWSGVEWSGVVGAGAGRSVGGAIFQIWGGDRKLTGFLYKFLKESSDLGAGARGIDFGGPRSLV